MCYSLQIKFPFREALMQNDPTLLKSVMRRYSSGAQLQRLLSEERFNGFTALQQACMQQNTSIVSTLIENGADVEQRGKHGWTALHAAAFSCKDNVQIIVLLLNSCADVVAKDNHGCLPVDLAASDVIRELLLQKMEERGKTPLVHLYRKLEESKSKVPLSKDASISGCSHSSDIEHCEQSSNESSNYCEYRQQRMHAPYKMQQERWLTKRKVSSCYSKGKRDSGIFSDDSDTLSIW